MMVSFSSDIFLQADQTKVDKTTEIWLDGNREQVIWK